jgi:hypothetical protein
MGAHGQTRGLVPQGGPDELDGQRELLVGIVVPRLALGAHVVIAQIGQADVVELEIAAARGVEVGDLRPVRGGGVFHEAVEIGVHRLVDVLASHLRVEHAGRRHGQLGRARDRRFQERERRDEDRMRPRDPARDGQIRPGEEDLARRPTEGDGQRLARAGEAAELGQEVHVPGLAPELAIRDALEARVLLELHDVADARVLGVRELLGGGLP